MPLQFSKIYFSASKGKYQKITEEIWQKRPSVKMKKSNNKDIKTKYKQKKKMNNNKKSKPIKTIKRL